MERAECMTRSCDAIAISAVGSPGTSSRRSTCRKPPLPLPGVGLADLPEHRREQPVLAGAARADEDRRDVLDAVERAPEDAVSLRGTRRRRRRACHAASRAARAR